VSINAREDHLDEVVVTVAGKKHWLWRAVDQDDICSMRSSRADATPRPLNAC
jgi:putative transposase